MDTTSSREHLSALMDGELGAEPARFLLRRMQGDSELARTWSRWHLIRACLAERAPSSPHADPLRVAAASDDDAFAARVMAQIRMASPPRRHWARYIGGGAIAAGVAAAALILSVPQSPSTGSGIAGAGQSTRAPVAALPPAPAARIAAAPVSRELSPPWLDRQSMFLAERPTMAGSLSGEYLQQAAYAPDAAAPLLMREPQQRADGAPYLILLVPDRQTPPQPPPH